MFVCSSCGPLHARVAFRTAALLWAMRSFGLWTHRLVLLCVDAYCFIFWDLPGDVLAAPESALCGWIAVTNSLSVATGLPRPSSPIPCFLVPVLVLVLLRPACVHRLNSRLLEQRERERERERVLHLSSHTGLMQALPGHPLADPKRECQSLCRTTQRRQGQTTALGHGCVPAL